MVNRVLIGPIEIAGFATALSEGLIQNGWRSHVFCKKRHRFDYEIVQTPNAFVEKLNRWVACSEALKERRGFCYKLCANLLKKLSCCLIIIWALVKVRYIVLLFNRSFTNSGIDLILFKLFRKKVTVVNLGSDTRPEYLSGSWLRSNDFNFSESFVRKTQQKLEKKRKRILFWDRWTAYTVDNPLAGHLHTRRCVNWFAMGFPIRKAPIISKENDQTADKVTVLHAPSNRGLKGSDLIQSVVDELLQEGLPIEYIELESVPNEEVKKILHNTDIVIDQLWSDTPLAGLACEAAAAGCCVIVGGNDWRYFQTTTLPLPPSILTSYESLKKTVTYCVENLQYRKNKSKELQKFAVTEWSSQTVAARYIKLFRGELGAEYFFEPKDSTYYGGCGAPIEYFRDFITIMESQ